MEQRLLNGAQDFTEEELQELIEYEVDRIEGDDRRWSRSVKSIIEVEGRLFSIDWEQGLTEYQEDSYDFQPVEVEKVEEEKLIKVTSYVIKE